MAYEATARITSRTLHETYCSYGKYYVRGAAIVFAVALSACAGTKQAVAPALLPPSPPPPGINPPPAGSGLPQTGLKLGIDAGAVRARYGSPAFVRNEADSEMWRYDSGICTAFFFFYYDNGALRLRYAETLPRGKDSPADETCLNAIKMGLAPAAS